MLSFEDWGVSLEANCESKIEQLIISRKRFNFQHLISSNINKLSVSIELKKEKVQRKKRHTTIEINLYDYQLTDELVLLFQHPKVLLSCPKKP